MKNRRRTEWARDKGQQRGGEREGNLRKRRGGGGS